MNVQLQFLSRSLVKSHRIRPGHGVPLIVSAKYPIQVGLRPREAHYCTPNICEKRSMSTVCSGLPPAQAMFGLGVPMIIALPVLAALAIITLAWIDLQRKTRTPTLSYQPTKFNEGVMSRMPTLKEVYKPMLFLTNGHVETIFAAKFRWACEMDYRRENIFMPDGGLVSLDWRCTPAGEPVCVLVHAAYLTVNLCKSPITPHVMETVQCDMNVRRMYVCACSVLMVHILQWPVSSVLMTVAEYWPMLACSPTQLKPHVSKTHGLNCFAGNRTICFRNQKLTECWQVTTKLH